jgi:predicted alpha/beta superfamily hydrolase
MAAPTIQLPGTEVHQLHSPCVGDEFEISIIPPPPGVGPVPVVYGTDAQLAAGLAASTIPMLVMSGEIPPVLVVLVGYPIGGDFAKFIQLRTRDFTPTVDERQVSEMAAMAGGTVTAGGAPAFLTFLTEELRPWVKERYDVTEDAIYVGDSLGGLFGTWVLLHHPAAFTRYVIGSAWLCWDEPVSTGWEAAYAASHADLPATVFLAAGAEEHLRGPYAADWVNPVFARADTAGHTQRLGRALAGRGYPSLRLTTRILPEATHFTIPGALVAQGLRNVFTPAT